MTTLRLRVAPVLGAVLALVLVAMGIWWTPHARWLLVGLGVGLLVVIGLGLAFMVWKPPSEAPPGGRPSGLIGMGVAFLVLGVVALADGRGSGGGAFLPPVAGGLMLVVCGASVVGLGIRQGRRVRGRGAGEQGSRAD